MIDSSFFGNVTAFDQTNQATVPAAIFADRPLKLLSPEEWPNADWNTMRANYELCYAYYKGFVLNKTAGDNKTLLYPVRLNVVRSAVVNHAAVMLGQFEENDIVKFGAKTGYGYDEFIEPTCRVLNLFWQVNDGDDILIEQALHTQVFGGTFWKVAWTPTRGKWPIRLFGIDPRAVYAVHDGNDVHRLVSVDIDLMVPRPTAIARYRMDLTNIRTSDNGAAPGMEEYVHIHEHWDENEFEITVNGELGQWVGGLPMAGINPYIDPVFGVRVVPFVYQPRNRFANGMYGEALPPGLMGPQDEINNMLGHLGEGVADAMHQQPWVRNRQKGTTDLQRPRNEWIDLGMEQSQQKNPPEVGRLEGAKITDPMTDYVTDDLPRLAREHVNMPDVAFGRTDSSIRSALTLKFMMWPAINMGLRYRRHLATSLKWLMYRVLVVAHSQNQEISNKSTVYSSLGVPEVDPKWIETVIAASRVHLPPMLPDDRAEQVNEMVQRITANLISPESGIRRLDGDDDIEAELNRIDKHRKILADLEAQVAQASFEAKQKAFNNRQPSDRSTRKQAEGGRKSGGESK
jgi:hypothetical protein